MAVQHPLDAYPENALNELPFQGTSLFELVKLPKLDLHRHLIGSIRPEVLVYIAEKLNITLPTFGNDSERIRSASIISVPLVDGYTKFLRQRIWGVFKEIFSNTSGVANAIYWAIADASRDGVCYVEFRVSPYGREFNLKSTLTTDQFLEALARGISKASDDFPSTKAKVILSVGREGVVKWWGDSAERARRYDLLIECANKFKDFVVGFDITGDENTYRNSRFVDFADKVKSAEFFLTVHAGETGDPNSVREAVELLGADRIGHGLGAVRDPMLMEQLLASKTTLEICPTSNLMLGVVPSLSEHPFKEFNRRGLRVTINTDDPVLLGPTSQSRELYQMISAEQMPLDILPQLTEVAIQSSFASEKEKVEIIATVRDATRGNSNAQAAVL